MVSPTVGTAPTRRPAVRTRYMHAHDTRVPFQPRTSAAQLARLSFGVPMVHSALHPRCDVTDTMIVVMSRTNRVVQVSRHIR
jgi:hypothetical protein